MGLGGGNRVPLSGSCDIIPGRASSSFPEVLTRGCASRGFDEPGPPNLAHPTLLRSVEGIPVLTSCLDFKAFLLTPRNQGEG